MECKDVSRVSQAGSWEVESFCHAVLAFGGVCGGMVDGAGYRGYSMGVL